MALNADNVRAALNGKILMAPKGTAAPADLTTPWGTGWVDLGYLDDNGVTMGYSTGHQDIKAWQSLSPVRKILNSVDLTLKFVAIELKAAAVSLYFPSSTISLVSGSIYRLDIPSAPEPEEWAFGLEWEDGTIVNRMVVPRGEVTDRSDVKIHRDAVGLEMTVSAYASSSPDIATWLSNDPSWAPS